MKSSPARARALMVSVLMGPLVAGAAPRLASADPVSVVVVGAAQRKAEANKAAAAGTAAPVTVRADPPAPAKAAAPPVVTPAAAGEKTPVKAAHRDRPQPTLPLSPTPDELRQIQQRRDAAEQSADHSNGRRLPTRTGDTSGPTGRAGAGTSRDRKESVLEGIGPNEGGVRR